MAVPTCDDPNLIPRYEELMLVCPPGWRENARVRRVTSCGEMAASFLNAGAGQFRDSMSRDDPEPFAAFAKRAG